MSEPLDLTGALRLLEFGDLAGADAAFRALLAANPGDAKAIADIAHGLHKAGRLGDAVNAFAAACRMEPRDEQMRIAHVQAIVDALTAAPGHVKLLEELGQALADAGDMEGARNAYVAALVGDPQAIKPRWMAGRLLPRVYTSLADINKWRSRFVAAVDALCASVHPKTPAEAEPALRGLMLGSNFELPYQAQNDRVLQERWGALTTRVMAARFPDLATRPPAVPLDGRADRRLKIGYASACFHSHTITLLFNGWLRHADKTRFQIHTYLLGGPRDSSSEALLRLSEVGRDLTGADVEAQARVIRADALDILVYPDLGMNSQGFALAALPLVPVQCVSWGHPITSGLPSMNYFLSSAAMEPDGSDDQYSETLVRLPRLSIAYTPAAVPPQKDRKALGLPDGTLYLCCQAQQKYLPMHDGVFPAIARQVPDARFVFVLHRSLHHANRLFRARLEQAFRAAGIDPGPHLVFLPWLDWRDFLDLNAACDVFLDSIGWSGGNTTLEALSRGLPPVTLPTGLMRGRHTYAMLKLMGMDELIAGSLEAYVAVAARLGVDANWRAEVRARIAERRTGLFNDAESVRALETFYAHAFAESLKGAVVGA